MRRIANLPARQGRAWLAQLGALALALGVLSLLETPLAANPIAEALPPQPPSELVGKRTATSRTFDNHDGTYTTALHSGPVHYRDAQGQWRPISSALVPTAESGYGFENEANRFRTLFKPTLGPDYLAIETGGGRFLLTLQNAAQVNAQSRPRGITYPSVFPGVDLRYDLRPDGMKETLLLANAQAPLSYRFLLKRPADAHVHAARAADGSWAFFMAPHARPVFVIDAPWAAEHDQPVSDRRHASLAVTRVGDDFALDLSVDGTWLRAPGRQFPVRVDPTITIQPPIQDASFDFACPGCSGVASDRLSIGTGNTGFSANTWRSALQFSLADIPPGATVSNAKLKLYFDGTCVSTSVPQPCGGTSHQVDALRMTSSWAPDSKTSDLAFDTTPLTSFTLPSGASAQWMNWEITGTVQNWASGAQSNFGLLLKRATEPPAASGPRPPSRNYAAEPTLGPKLEVTYNGDGGELLDPETVHANGAELRWIPYGGPGAPPFDRYEVHRSATPGFTPSDSTRLTTIMDSGANSYRDTTAKAGATFTYQVVVNGFETNARTVTLPAAGQARKTLRPDPAAGLDTYVTERTDSTDCVNRGALDRLKVGTDAISIWRSLLAFDLADLSPDATVSDVTLSLWHPETTSATLNVRAHRATANWQEGTGTDKCTGDGTTWYETVGGVAWAQEGGDFDPAVAASLSIPSGSPAGWSQWSLTSLAQQWVSGVSPNMGLVLKLDDETRVPGKSVDFYSSDFAVAPTLRPKLSLTYTETTSAAVAPRVSIAKPPAGELVKGTAVEIVADAWDDRRVDSVQFFVDGNSIGTDSSDPFSLTWNSTSVPNGAHSLTARATDDAGNQTTSAAVSVTVGNSAPPTTSITSPTGGSVTGTVTVITTANDDVAVTKVELYADGLLVGTNTGPGPQYSFNWNTLDPALPAYDGPHTLTAKAYDAHAQVTTSAPVTVTAANTVATMYRASYSSTPIPSRMEHKLTPPPLQYPVDVTVTNLSTSTWSTVVLRYRWYGDDPAVPLPGGGEANVGTLLPNGSVPVHLDVVPPALAAGNARRSYRLRFDLYDTASASFFAARGNKPLENDVQVGVDEWEQRLGLEPYFHYEREQLGLGMESLVNVATGNNVVRWRPFQAPGQGLSTVVELTYNALNQDDETIVGRGWSLAISSLTRLGSELDFVVPTSCSVGSLAVLIDADGTRHPFKMVQGASCTDVNTRWKPPDGVHLYLRKVGDGPGAVWKVTRPDRLTYVYEGDDDSPKHRLPLFVEDKNGNKITFNYAGSPPRISSVRDQAGRDFGLEYHTQDGGCAKGGKVSAITDHTGSRLEFCYDADGGELLGLTQVGGGNVNSRSFAFSYEDDGAGPPPCTSDIDGSLTRVEDPNGRITKFDYHGGYKLCQLDDRDPRTGPPPTNTATGMQLLYTPDDANPRLTTVNKLAPDGTRETVYRDDRDQSPPPPPAPPVFEDGLVDTIRDPAGRTTTIHWTNEPPPPPPPPPGHPDYCPVAQPLRHVRRVDAPGPRLTRYCYNHNGRVTRLTDPMLHLTQFAYLDLPADGGDGQNSISLLREYKDPEQNLWSFTYDAGNVNLEKVIDPDGSAADPFMSFDYYSGPPGPAFRGALWHAYDANDHSTTFEDYDPNGFPTRVTDAKSQVTKYFFDADGLLRTIQDPLHEPDGPYLNDRWYKTRFDYDDFHRLFRRSEPKSTRFETGTLIWSDVVYDPNDNVVTVHQPDYQGVGATTSFTYDEMDRPELVTNPDGEKTAFAYDEAGRVVQVTRPKGLLNPPPPPPPTDPNKDYSTEYRYDSLDRIVSEIVYDADGAANRRTHYCYDTPGDLRWVTAPRAALDNAPPSCETDEGVPQYTTRYGYDSAHRLTSVTEPLSAGTTRMRRYQYDENGNVERFIDERGTDTEFFYTRRNELEKKIETFTKPPALRQLTTLFVYDRAGNLTCQVSPRAWDVGSRCADPQNPGAYVTQYRYDDVDQLERIALPDDPDPIPARTYLHRRYDANGNLRLTTLSVADSELGTLCQTEPEQCTELEHFDPGWIYSSHDNVNPKVYFDYEAEGWQNRRKVCDEGCKTTIQTYASDGLLRFVHRASRRREREGDALAEYRYDANNNLTFAFAQRSVRASDAASTITADYNGYDESTLVSQRRQNEPDTHFTDYTYDANGNVATRVDNRTPPSQPGRKHEFAYDQADQLTEDYDWVDGTRGNTGDLRTDYLYELTGWDQRKTVTRLDGSWQTKVRTTWDYFDNGDLKTLSTWNKEPGEPGAEEVERHDLTYMAGAVYMNGNRVIDSFKLKNPSATTCWTTDCTTTYSYGPRDNVTYEDNSWRADIRWAYDEALNAIEKETVGSPTPRVFTYQGNRLDEERAAGQLVARYLYDLDGNVDCVVGAGWTDSKCPAAPAQGAPIDPALIADYRFDFLNRLEKFRQFVGGSASADYSHDALDRLLMETTTQGGTTRRTCFSYLGLSQAVSDERRVGQTQTCDAPPTLTKSYGFDADLERTSMAVTGGANPGNYFYARNVHGDPSLLLNENGGRMGSYAYSAYGDAFDDLTREEHQEQATLFNSYRFNDRRLDALSGSADMGARRYSSAIGAGRFLQSDFYEVAGDDLSLSLDPLTMNRYAFAAGNPLSFLEMDGHRFAATGRGMPAPRRREERSGSSVREKVSAVLHGVAGAIEAAGHRFEDWTQRKAEGLRAEARQQKGFTGFFKRIAYEAGADLLEESGKKIRTTAKVVGRGLTGATSTVTAVLAGLEQWERDKDNPNLSTFQKVVRAGWVGTLQGGFSLGGALGGVALCSPGIVFAFVCGAGGGVFGEWAGRHVAQFSLPAVSWVAGKGEAGYHKAGWAIHHPREAAGEVKDAGTRVLREAIPDPRDLPVPLPPIPRPPVPDLGFGF